MESISTTADVRRPHAGVAAYRGAVRRKTLLLGGLGALLAGSLLLDLLLGPAGLTAAEVLGALLSPSRADDGVRIIVRDIRLPVALMALIVGASLSIAGAQMQTILNNPLASPFTLGISAAAGFGASLAMVLGIGLPGLAGAFVVPFNAFAVAMLTAWAIHALSRVRGVSAETMVLLGIAMVFTFNALMAMLQYVASGQVLQEVVFWSLGSLAKATWPKVAVGAAALALTLPFLARCAWRLTALRLGEEKARSLGIDVAGLRLKVLLAVSFLAAVSVAFVGIIGFVGLVGPHVARMLVGEDQRFFLPMSAVTGALLLSLTSILSKTIVPGVVFPIGILTALIGVPFFLGLVLTKRRNSWS